MTDLEKLAKQFLSKDFSDDVKDTDGIAISDDDRDIVPLVAILEQTRAAGRIEGLQEAEELCRLVRDGLTVTTPDTHEVWCAIRARIQELEGKRNEQG